MKKKLIISLKKHPSVQDVFEDDLIQLITGDIIKISCIKGQSLVGYGIGNNSPLQYLIPLKAIERNFEKKIISLKDKLDLL